MTAGLPGVGLSGIFFIVSALLMVPLEIARTIRGRSSLARWLSVLRHLAIAISMIVALELMYAALRLCIDELEALGVLGSHATSAHRGMRLLPFAPVLATLALIACLLLIAKTAELRARRLKPRGVQPRSVSAPPLPRGLGAGRET